MRIGFIGTGTISAAMIDGLMASNLAVKSIVISPRNKELAEALAKRHQKVSIATDNQSVIDATDHVFLCLRSQIAEEALKQLKFRADQQVISVLAMASAAMVESWIGHKVYRAVPLPFVEHCKGLTPIYPEDDFLKTMFEALGGALVVKEERAFNLFMTAGSFMGVYFRFMETTNQWLQDKGLDEKTARAYLANVYGNLADVMRQQSAPDFKALECEYSTKGGTNELIAYAFGDKGGEKILCDAIEDGFKRIKG